MFPERQTQASVSTRSPCWPDGATSLVYTKMELSTIILISIGSD
jgi:hypothetical protein